MTGRYPDAAGRLLLAIGTILILAAPAAAKSLALVIGNDDYRNIPALAKGVGDGRAVKGALASLGFDVTVVENATYRTMTEAIAKFGDRIARDDLVFFYFSGYGIAIGGENLLLPIDVPKSDARKEGSLPRLTLPVAETIASLQTRGAKVVVAVLDACRDNPFADGGKKGATAARGLAPMSPPPGTFILYSAAAGQASLDRLSDTDTRETSIFARALLRPLLEPNRSLVEIAKETQQRAHDFAATARYDQLPAYYDATVGDVILSAARPARDDEAAATARDEGESPSVGPLSAAKAPGNVQMATVSVGPTPSEEQAHVRSTHGDWQVHCEKPAGSQADQCVVMQYVVSTKSDSVGLTVILLQTADRKSRIMRVLGPLGLLLPSGLGLSIDGADVGRAGFVRCLPNGCVAEVILRDPLLRKLEGGKTATFIIFQTPEEGIGIPISLNGLAAATTELFGLPAQ